MKKQAWRATAPALLGASRLALGELVALDPEGRAFIVCEGTRLAVAAQTVTLSAADVGRRVVLLFEGDDHTHPIVTGVLRAVTSEVGAGPAVELDGGRLVLTAAREIVLRCGSASVVLEANGNVRVKGANVSTTASAQNRIRGASVKIN
jgi:phage gp45-like